MGELEGDNLAEMFPLKYLKIVVLVPRQHDFRSKSSDFEG